MDSYLASGLLAQFQGLPNAIHPNQSVAASSSKTQQSSEDDSAPRDGVEEVSECSQSSAVVGCSNSTCDLVNTSAHAKDECLGHSFAHEWGSTVDKDWQLNQTEIAEMASLDFARETTGQFVHSSSGQFMHSLTHSEDHKLVPFQLQTSMGLSNAPSMLSMVLGTENPDHLFASENGCSTLLYPETRAEGPFPSGNNVIDGSANTVLYQSSNYQIPEDGHLASQSCHPLKPEMLEATSFCEPFAVSSQLPVDDESLIFGIDPNLFNDSLVLQSEQERFANKQDGFIYSNDAGSSPSNNAINGSGMEQQLDRGNDSMRLVRVNDFDMSPPKNVHTNPAAEENTPVSHKQKDSGTLFYEPPRFPSLDIPFFSCDLIQSSTDMQQEYSPLGIRQLMMSSINCTPFRLWDSPKRDDSPDAVLKSAAKTFTGTPSILKKRHRDLVSPLSEKRCEKKLESDLTQEPFTSLTRDFSRLEVMFNGTGNENPPVLSPLANQKKHSETAVSEEKENQVPACLEGEKERMNNSSSESRTLGKSVKVNVSHDKMKQKTGGTDDKAVNSSVAALETVSTFLSFWKFFQLFLYCSLLLGWNVKVLAKHINMNYLKTSQKKKELSQDGYCQILENGDVFGDISFIFI